MTKQPTHNDHIARTLNASINSIIALLDQHSYTNDGTFIGDALWELTQNIGDIKSRFGVES